mmetsp:Transcript_39539/g.80665  ORF Transcript_39539/g.80665 Transcript_39539/m.80665 type:complete len:113 (-) Transcript_39539:536-874(-)
MTNQEPPTDTQRQGKRTRIDPSAKDPSTADRPQNQARQPPKSLAEAFIRSHVASLHPQLASILEKLGIDQVHRLQSVYNKQTQSARMEDDSEFIPRSARLEFKFHMTKSSFC